jgi:hypothetical protein
MSSYQSGVDYYSNLIKQANTLKQEQENRQRKLVADYETKIRQSNISQRERQAEQNQASNRTITPRKQTLIEPNTAYTREAVSGMGQLYEKAKAYNPFATQKTQAQLNMPLTYFNTLTGEVNTYIKGNQDKFASQIADVKTRQAKEIEDLKKKYGINENTNYFNNYNYSNFIRDAAWLNRKYEQEINAYNTQLGRFNTIAGNVISSQTKTLSDLNAELKKYYGQNFENISKEQLAVADLKSFMSLKADIEKYTDLRDTYIKKYQSDPSKFNMDWVNQYNNLLNDTAKAISSELPKIFTAAGKQVSTIQKTQQDTLASLEKLNEVFGERGKAPVKTVEQREQQVKDVTNVSRDQALARLQRLSTSGAGSAKSKPAPKYEERPT